MSLGGALAAALIIGARGEKEIAGKGARSSVGPIGIVAIKSERVPARLRIQAPTEMRQIWPSRSSGVARLSSSQCSISFASIPPLIFLI